MNYKDSEAGIAYFKAFFQYFFWRDGSKTWHECKAQVLTTQTKM
jgi:hypothetical protein